MRNVLSALERFYGACAEDLSLYLGAQEDALAREEVLVRQGEQGVELALLMPARLLAPQSWEALSLDDRCQLVEGASHFLVICDRARDDRPTTQLELELQAEVDKWLVLSRGGRLDHDADAALRQALFELGAFLHGEESTEGTRYRLANHLAARFVDRLFRVYVCQGRLVEMRAELVRFFRMGQEDKLRTIAA